MQREALAGYAARHFRWQVDARVATITLDRPEKKNPLTFDSYAELRDLFRALATADDVRADAFVREVVAIHARLRALDSLAPGPVVNQSLSRLVAMCCEIVPSATVQRVSFFSGGVARAVFVFVPLLPRSSAR